MPSFSKRLRSVILCVPGADEYRLMVEHFVDAARGDAAPECLPADSINNMRVLDALAAAARTGETVRVSAYAPGRSDL